MKRLIVVLALPIMLLLPAEITARGGALPDTCGPEVLDDGTKAYVCDEGTALTDDQQARLDRINANLTRNQAQHQDRLQQIEDRKAATRDQVEERKASREARLNELSQQRVDQLFATMVTRISAAIERLNLLIDRIQARLDIYSESNPDLDLTDIDGDLEAAEILLDEALANLEAAEATLPDVLESEDPKEAFAIIRETVAEIKDKLKEAHSILVHVIGDIKGLRIGNSEVDQES